MSATQLREIRTPLQGAVRYVYGDPEEAGVARWREVSRTGARVLLGRYLRPGRWLALSFDSPLAANAPLTVRARVAWCKPLESGVEFEAGLQILRETPEMALDFAALGYRVQSNTSPRPVVETTVPTPWRWTEHNNEIAGGALQPQAV